MAIASILPIEAPINISPVNIHAIKKVVKLAVTHQVIVFTKVLFFKSADIIYHSSHILIIDLLYLPLNKLLALLWNESAILSKPY